MSAFRPVPGNPNLLHMPHPKAQRLNFRLSDDLYIIRSHFLGILCFCRRQSDGDDNQRLPSRMKWVYTIFGEGGPGCVWMMAKIIDPIWRIVCNKRYVSDVYLTTVTFRNSDVIPFHVAEGSVTYFWWWFFHLKAKPPPPHCTYVINISRMNNPLIRSSLFSSL